jgi:modulator of FtsH protease
MDRNVLGFPVEAGSTGRSLESQRVLRNTYWLLALSMLPTIAGAWFGVASGLFGTMLRSPGVTMIVFFAGAFGLMYAIERTKNSAAGVGVLLAFTFFMGVMMSRLIGIALGFANGAQLIAVAFGGTAGIFAVMATIATVTKRDLSGLSKFLMVGALIVIAAGIMNFFVQSSALMLTISCAVMAIFSLYMLVDVKRVIDGGETNYIVAALQIYMDIYNVFQSLLILLLSLGGGGSSRD